MKPLAYLMRPNTFEDIVGQDHLVGENGIIRKMLKSNSLFSFILYGNPGCGKTTIAEATCKLSGFKWFKFNASTDNKETLKQIITEACFLDEAIIIVDELCSIFFKLLILENSIHCSTGTLYIIVAIR